MSISAGLTTSFKEELLLGGHDFSNSGASAGTFCISIYVNSSDVLDENLTAPPFGAEEIPSTGVSGAGGYTAGGAGAAFTGIRPGLQTMAQRRMPSALSYLSRRNTR